MKRLVQLFSRDGADNGLIEYGVIAAGLTLALVAILGQIGGALNTAF
jgi:Flp pilus assembly pilin Flp